MKNRLEIAIKFVISAACIAFVLNKVDFNEMIRLMGLLSYSTLIFSVLIFLSHFFLVATRWQYLLERFDEFVPFRDIVKVIAISSFLNNTPLGLFLADGYRVYILQKNGVRFKNGVGSVLLDRYVALLGAIVVTLVMLIATYNTLEEIEYWRPIFLGHTAIFFVLLIFTVMFGLEALSRFLKFEKLKRALIFFCNLSRLYVQSHKNTGQYLKVYLTTICVVLTSSLVVFTTAQDINIELSIGSAILVTSISLVAGVIPISIAGWGVRELSVVGLLANYDISADKGFIIAIVFSLSFVISSLFGGVLLLIEKNGGIALKQRPENK